MHTELYVYNTLGIRNDVDGGGRENSTAGTRFTQDLRHIRYRYIRSSQLIEKIIGCIGVFNDYVVALLCVHKIPVSLCVHYAAHKHVYTSFNPGSLT